MDYRICTKCSARHSRPAHGYCYFCELKMNEPRQEIPPPPCLSSFPPLPPITELPPPPSAGLSLTLTPRAASVNSGEAWERRRSIQEQEAWNELQLDGEPERVLSRRYDIMPIGRYRGLSYQAIYDEYPAYCRAVISGRVPDYSTPHAIKQFRRWVWKMNLLGQQHQIESSSDTQAEQGQPWDDF